MSKSRSQAQNDHSKMEKLSEKNGILFSQGDCIQAEKITAAVEDREQERDIFWKKRSRGREVTITQKVIMSQ